MSHWIVEFGVTRLTRVNVFTGPMDFSGLSLIKLKKEEMEAQVSVFMTFRNLQVNLLSSD